MLDAQKQRELARLGKEEVAQQEINKQKVEIEADARAEQTRRIARGEADAIIAVKTAEAEGQKKMLEAKAQGYERLFAACGDRPDLAPTLLMIEKLTDVVAEQVKAIQNLKIEKITVWDGGSHGNGNGHGGATAGFLSSLLGALPPMHELARQAGIELPRVPRQGRCEGRGSGSPGDPEVGVEARAHRSAARVLAERGPPALGLGVCGARASTARPLRLDSLEPRRGLRPDAFGLGSRRSSLRLDDGPALQQHSAFFRLPRFRRSSKSE